MKWMNKKARTDSEGSLILAQPVDDKDVSESAKSKMTNVAALLLMMLIWNQAVTVVPDQLPDWCHPHSTYSWIVKVSNGYVCNIMGSQAVKPGNQIKYGWKNRFCKPKTIRESCITRF